MKRCPRCKTEKPLSEFGDQLARLGKRQTSAYCRPCFRDYATNRWRTSPKIAARRASGLCPNDGRPVQPGRTVCDKCRAGMRNTRLKKIFGITTADYDGMLAKQGGGCAICGKANDTSGSRKAPHKRLAVDHDHATGKVRGLLCFDCNTAIGKAAESAPRLLAMAEYLEPTPEWIGGGC